MSITGILESDILDKSCDRVSVQDDGSGWMMEVKERFRTSYQSNI
jgi:hypothetical protein